MSLFFGDLNMKVFRLLSLFRFSINALWWNCALWIDDNMHWALIDLFCDALFFYMNVWFLGIAFEWITANAFKKSLTWVFIWGLLFRSLIDCTVTILCALKWWYYGLWLTCFVILFVYVTLSFPLLLLSGLLLSLSGRVICNFVPRGRQALVFDWVFFGELNMEVSLRSLFRFLIDCFVMKLCP